MSNVSFPSEMSTINIRLILLLYFSFCGICSFNCVAAPSKKPVQLEKLGVVTSNLDNEIIATKNAMIINRALLQYSGTGRPLILPAGKTWIASPISIPSYSILRGHSEGSTLNVSASIKGVQEGFIVNKDFTLYTPDVNKGIELVGFTLDATDIVLSAGQARGIFFNKVHGVKMDSLKIYNTIAEAIRVDVTNTEGSTKQVMITNCEINLIQTSLAALMIRSHTTSGNNLEFVTSNTKDIQIIRNRVLGGSHNIAIFNSNDVLVKNNVCTKGSQRGIILSPTCSNVFVIGNRIDSAGSTGIHMAYDAQNIVVDSNTVTNTLADMSGVGYEGQGIKAYAGFKNVRITNNICTGNATDGIALEGGGKSENFLIEKNTLKDNKRNGIRLQAGALTINRPGNLSEGLVQLNDIQNNLQEGIYVGSDNNGKNKVVNTTVSKNKIVQKGNMKSMKNEFTDPTLKVIED